MCAVLQFMEGVISQYMPHVYIVRVGWGCLTYKLWGVNVTKWLTPFKVTLLQQFAVPLCSWVYYSIWIFCLFASVYIYNCTIFPTLNLHVHWLHSRWIGELLFNVTINDISVIHVTAHRCAGGMKKKLYPRSGSRRHRHFVGFFNMPVQAPTRDQPFYTVIHTAPLVAFYDTLGIRGTHSRLDPRALMGELHS